MAQQKSDKPRNKKHISKSIRKQLQTWGIVIGCAFVMVGASFAWYTREDREADSKSADVMVPYYLELKNPSETAAMQLSIGNLPLGSKKQIVFCVTNKNPNEGNIKNKNTSVYILCAIAYNKYKEVSFD